MRPVAIVILAALCAAGGPNAAAQAPGSYPNRPIRMILPA